MPADELHELRALTAVRRAELAALDVIEDAEHVVRSSYEERLLQRLEAACAAFDAAADMLIEGRRGDDPAMVDMAEASLRAVQQRIAAHLRALDNFQELIGDMSKWHDLQRAGLLLDIERLEQQISHYVT